MMIRAEEPLLDIVGLTVERARNIVESAGWILRITEEDGKERCGTCEARNNRLNVTVEQGYIKGILHVG